MTLCFSQEQAAAVYAATKGSKDPVYVSPFLGRVDDQGQNGMDLVSDIKKMSEAGDGHVHVWGASVRTLKHLLAAVALQAELATAPSKVWEEWAAASFPLPEKDFVYQGVDKLGNQLRPIPYKSVDLNLPWESFDIRHEFVYDYKSTLNNLPESVGIWFRANTSSWEAGWSRVTRQRNQPAADCDRAN
jgi:transaldolase